MNQSLNANRNTGKILMYAALVLGAVLMIFPLSLIHISEPTRP